LVIIVFLWFAALFLPIFSVVGLEMVHVGNPRSKELLVTSLVGDIAGDSERREKERNNIGGIDVTSLAEFLAKLEATGLIHVNRRKLKQP
jgi:hypothetical protein